MKHCRVLSFLVLCCVANAQKYQPVPTHTIHIQGEKGGHVWIEGVLTKPDGEAVKIARHQGDLPVSFYANADQGLRLIISTDDGGWAV